MRHGLGVWGSGRLRHGRLLMPFASALALCAVIGGAPASAAHGRHGHTVRVEVKVGDGVELSAPTPLTRGGARGGLRFRWRLLDAPANSRYDHSLLGAGGRGTARGLGSPARARTRFRPDVPGTYRLSLTVSGGGSSRYELVDVEAVPGPLVAFDSMAQQNGSWGINVGRTFYSAGRGDLQVLVLQRDTLGMKSNTTYACAADPSSCAAQIATDLKGLDDTYLVIASAQPAFGGGWVSIVQHGALAGIGVASPPAPNAAGGYFSAVGFPGLAAGRATTNAPTPAEVKRGSDTTGALRGFLTPDQFGNYGYVSTDRVPFDTRAPGSDANDVVMTVGSQAFYGVQDSNYDGGGFVVACVSRENPNVVYDEGHFFTNYVDPGLAQSDVEFMADFLANKGNITCTPDPARTLIFISSFGDPYLPPQYQRPGSCGAVEWTCLAQVIGDIGGTESLFNALGDNSYSLVTTGGPQAHGIETSSAMTYADGTPMKQYADGRLTGVLTRGSDSLLSPTTADPAGAQIASAVQDVLFQPSQPWPGQGDPGKQAAISWIGEQVGLGADPRSAYWMKPWEFDWDSVRSDIRNLAYPGDGHGFAGSDFDWAKGELDGELGWLINTISYMKSLRAPFVDQQASNYIDVEKIAQTIKDSVKAPPDSQTEVFWRYVLQGIIAIPAAWAGEAAPVVTGLQGLLKLALNVTSAKDGGPQPDKVQATAVDLGSRLADQLDNTVKAFQLYSDIIASDYGKLKTVGECAFGSDKCPLPSSQLPDWQWSQTDQARAAAAVRRSFEGQVYGALIPTSFTLYQLPGFPPPNPWPTANQLKCDTYVAGNWDHSYPFADEPASGQVTLAASGGILALGSGFDWNNFRELVPPAGLLDPLFQAPDNSNPTGGGLGIYKPQFLLRYLTPEPFKPSNPPFGEQFDCPSTIGSPPAGGSPPTSTQLTSLLRRQLPPLGLQARIGAILRYGGYRFPFYLPATGRVRISWYAAEGRGRHEPPLAHSSTRFTSPAILPLTIRLSRAGHRLLATSRAARIRATLTFSPPRDAPITVTAIFTLTR